jgi:excisionase family DNA binding protein
VASVESLVYSVNQAAEALQVCTNTIRNLIRRGELPASRVGDRVMIKRQALTAFLDEKEIDRDPTEL